MVKQVEIMENTNRKGSCNKYDDVIMDNGILKWVMN